MASKGRPSKFTPEIRQRLLDRLISGTTIKLACESVGVGISTYCEWVEIGNAHLNNEPHRRMPRTLDERLVYAEFAEATTRAIADGMVRAVIAFKQGMIPSESVAVTTETVEETRINPKTGDTYTYRKTISRRTVTQAPGDWRAAMEFLARRDPEEWARAAAQRIEHSGKVTLEWEDQAIADIRAGLVEFAAMVKAFGDVNLVTGLFAKAGVPVSVGAGESED